MHAPLDPDIETKRRPPFGEFVALVAQLRDEAPLDLWLRTDADITHDGRIVFYIGSGIPFSEYFPGAN